MVQKIKHMVSKKASALKEGAKNLKRKIVPEPLLWRDQKFPTIGRTYIFPGGIKVNSTPKKSPRETFIIRTFTEGKLDCIHNKHFIFIGKDENGLKCIFYVPRVLKATKR